MPLTPEEIGLVRSTPCPPEKDIAEFVILCCFKVTDEYNDKERVHEAIKRNLEDIPNLTVVLVKETIVPSPFDTYKLDAGFIE